ncbi:MAG TPA: hypothetical protein VK711_10780 [Puia sp.]|nr:hypothetical protein [Puia sp.]
MEKEYRNIGYPFIFLLFLVFFGFFKTYFGLFPHFNEHTTAIVHFHVFVLVLWIILLIIQPILISQNKYATHRLIGRFTYFLVPLIILSFIGMMNKQITETSSKNLLAILDGIYLPLTDTFLFSTFYILAIINKRNTVIHMRYIIMTGLVFIDASLIRSLAIWFHVDFFYAALISISFVDLILITLIFLDKLKGRAYKPFLISLILFAMVQTGIIILRHH